uniref:Glycerol ester HYDROLAS (Fragments) n=1 Tax=Camelus dromedarius TaxID=9838 RepID=Q9TS81_CAMDR
TEVCFERLGCFRDDAPWAGIFVDVIHTDAAPMIPNLGFGMSQTRGSTANKCFPCPSEGCPQ